MPALTLNGAAGSFPFLAAQATDGAGFLFKIPQPDEDPLLTEGVDGKRWRTKYEQVAPVTLEAVAEAADFASAVSSAQGMRSLKGSLVQVIWAAGGHTYIYKDVHVSAADAKPMAGAIVGGGASSGSAAHVRATFVLEPTDFATFATT